MTKFPFQWYKGGRIPTTNMRGAQVTITLAGRTYLGDVVDVYKDFHSGAYKLKVRYFNGEAWPFDPTFIAVDVLERRAA